MIACLDWSGSGEGSGSRSGARGAGGGGKASGKHTKKKGADKPSKKQGPQPLGERELAPSMFVIAARAPSIAEHRPAFDEATVQAVFARKRAAREERIAELVAQAEKEGRPSERIVAAIIYDSEHAPHSTNRRQLAEIGVECPARDPAAIAALDDKAVAAALWRVIYGLAHLGIFLCGTNHLPDRALLRILCTRILEEEIRDVPPSRDMNEFIDLTPCRADHPDGLDGPFDLDDGDGEDECPVGPSLKPVAERDALLPRPNRDLVGPSS